ncbi:hypothetical protein [Rhodococcus koreensis]|uniref:hypothetical protein n=1 Tax=Rhodococcus koreensis TaxID=99653 RepID=UPI00142889E3|nr:hypothetical protein [Rhodococcus koreensis]
MNFEVPLELLGSENKPFPMIVVIVHGVSFGVCLREPCRGPLCRDDSAGLDVV